jgi:hypothetical protein
LGTQTSSVTEEIHIILNGIYHGRNLKSDNAENRELEDRSKVKKEDVEQEQECDMGHNLVVAD